MVMVRGRAGWAFPLDHSACAKGWVSVTASCLFAVLRRACLLVFGGIFFFFFFLLYIFIFLCISADWQFGSVSMTGWV